MSHFFLAIIKFKMSIAFSATFHMDHFIRAFKLNVSLVNLMLSKKFLRSYLILWFLWGGFLRWSEYIYEKNELYRYFLTYLLIKWSEFFPNHLSILYGNSKIPTRPSWIEIIFEWFSIYFGFAGFFSLYFFPPHKIDDWKSFQLKGDLYLFKCKNVYLHNTRIPKKRTTM